MVQNAAKLSPTTSQPDLFSGQRNLVQIPLCSTTGGRRILNESRKIDKTDYYEKKQQSLA